VPNLAFTASKAALTDDSSVISRASGSTSTFGLAFLMLASVSFNVSSFWAVMMTPLAPARANASERPYKRPVSHTDACIQSQRAQTCLPMPLEAPVIMTTLPACESAGDFGLTAGYTSR
jgi:hypothetical protein